MTVLRVSCDSESTTTGMPETCRLPSAVRPEQPTTPAALTALAQTYDPQVLGTMRVRGVKPDPSKAKALYDQAEAARKRR